MQSEAGIPSKSSRTVRPDFATRLLKPLARWLQTGDPAATVDRLFASQHVKDLRLIIAVACCAVLVVIVIGPPLSFEYQRVMQWSEIKSDKTDWIYLHIALAALAAFLTFVVPVLAAFGAVLAWVYQVGGARLGVVDLFACEISTLCRVVTVVGTVGRYVERFDKGPPTKQEGTGGADGPAHQFISQENYFPVFENGTRDLQSLEARVVINITAFYTYMKAVRDSQRALSSIRPQPDELDSPSDSASTARPWHDAARNVVYMMFLSLESARHAIADLVEFEPEKAERSIVVLISELEAYRFLRGQFPDERDMHYQRIILREAEYRKMVPWLVCSVEAGRASEKGIESGTESHEPGQVSRWEPAWRLLPELHRRYEAVIAPNDR